MNKYLFNTFILIVLALIIILLPYPSNAEDNYIIDGNTVYIDDENVCLSAYPHTIYESGYVYFNFSSKNYNGDIDTAFGFNISLIKPIKAEIYNSNINTWVNFPLSFTLLSKKYQNCDKWYYIKDIPIISNKNYKLRIWIETPISTNVNKGKYLFAVKPSFETIQQSIDNNRLYVLDPWFNISFTDRQKIIITTNGTTIPQNYQILLNVTYNNTMQNDFADIRFTNLTNGSLSYWVESKVNLEYANIWVNLSNEIIHPNNDIIYMYYGNNQVNSISNGNNTFIGWHGSTTLNFLDSLIIPSSNIIYESKYRVTTTAHSTICGIYNIPTFNDESLYIFTYSTTNLRSLDTYNDAALSRISETPSFTLNQWYKLKITQDGTTARGYVNNNEISTGQTINLPDEYMGLGMSTVSGTHEQEYSFVRKYITNEPIISYNISEYYTTTLHYNSLSNYNHTIESDGIIITNRSLNIIDNTYWTAKSSNITYWIFTKEINSSGYTNFTIKKDNLNNFTVKLKQYSYYSLNNSSLINIFNTNQYGNADININLIPDDYYILFINQSLIPPPIKPLYPIYGVIIIKDDACINNINKIIVYKNDLYFGIYNYSDEILYLNNTNYTFFINYDNIDIINSENFLISFFKNYGYIFISIIGIIIIIGICIYFFNKVKR